MAWGEYIEALREYWIGREVSYEGKKFRVVGVDYNGALLIDKRAMFTETTAISETMLDK